MYKLYYLLFTAILLKSPIYADDVRALWVVRYALNSEAETTEIISTAKALQITDLFIQVHAIGKKFGYTNPGQPGPFANLVKSAHQENIKVHAWLNALYIWASDSPPTSPPLQWTA